MDTTQTIKLIFKSSEGEKVSMSINNAKENLKKDEISAAMDTVIEKNIFDTKYGNLVEKAGAQVIERNVTKYEMA
ncbi:DUF2922 domain-containing protein [Clostridium botulinum]|uniref:DUF2922 domain-containing protein n=1 Tax=Clostridium botulinum TaxID=1491 RepID=UPI00016BBB6F|nr:DUF2922 domain-containing protein [Clostridium botulinum]WCJ75375.1 DUF2922 domain-containing protein [Clostridium botulinum]WCJ79214.1 DUF2922 domain-containing protein [Clostridium botulinum]WCJ83035.1 DUF2922 domain-containing protein [Clostridium botulinum]